MLFIPGTLSAALAAGTSPVAASKLGDGLSWPVDCSLLATGLVLATSGVVFPPTVGTTASGASFLASAMALSA